MDIIAIGSKDWHEILQQQKRQADALERIATVLEKSVTDSAKIAELTQALKAHTDKLAIVLPAAQT